MSVRLTPVLVAVVLTAVLVVALFVPYVARQYRRRGELGFGHAALSMAGLLYALGLVAYVSVPLPTLTPDFCALHGVGVQLQPLQFVVDMQKYATGGGLGGLLRNPALSQMLLNVALFVPLGMLVRYMFRRGILATTAIGFAVSLFIEVTQLTGTWFLLPCPYRLFDVDDLTANTVGALLGAVAAPVLRLVPGQRAPSLPSGAPRPVTARRRLLGIVCDLLAFQILAALLGAVMRVTVLAVNGMLVPGAGPIDDLPGFTVYAPLVETWLPWALLFVVFPLAGDGAGFGQRAVQLGAFTADGGRPGPGRRLARSMAGVGGYLLLTFIGGQEAHLGAAAAAGGLAFLLAVSSLIGVWSTRGHRGLSYAVTDLRLADVRTRGAVAGRVPAVR